jgi:hypothetical protein
MNYETENLLHGMGLIDNDSDDEYEGGAPNMSYQRLKKKVSEKYRLAVPKGQRMSFSEFTQRFKESAKVKEIWETMRGKKPLSKDKISELADEVLTEITTGLTATPSQSVQEREVLARTEAERDALKKKTQEEAKKLKEVMAKHREFVKKLKSNLTNSLLQKVFMQEGADTAEKVATLFIEIAKGSTVTLPTVVNMDQRQKSLYNQFLKYTKRMFNGVIKSIENQNQGEALKMKHEFIKQITDINSDAINYILSLRGSTLKTLPFVKSDTVITSPITSTSTLTTLPIIAQKVEEKKKAEEVIVKAATDLISSMTQGKSAYSTFRSNLAKSPAKKHNKESSQDYTTRESKMYNELKQTGNFDELVKKYAEIMVQTYGEYQ